MEGGTSASYLNVDLKFAPSHLIDLEWRFRHISRGIVEARMQVEGHLQAPRSSGKRSSGAWWCDEATHCYRADRVHTSCFRLIWPSGHAMLMS